MAGWPDELKPAVKIAYGVERTIGISGFSSSPLPISPISAGGSAIVGVSSRS